MSVEENKTFVRQYFETLGKDKSQATLEQYIGKEDPALFEHVESAEQGFPGYRLVETAMIAEGDLVAVRFQLQSNHAATGKPVDVPGMIWYQVRDGKIVAHWMILDNETLMKQVSAAPEVVGVRPSPGL